MSRVRTFPAAEGTPHLFHLKELEEDEWGDGTFYCLHSIAGEGQDVLAAKLWRVIQWRILVSYSASTTTTVNADPPSVVSYAYAGTIDTEEIDVEEEIGSEVEFFASSDATLPSQTATFTGNIGTDSSGNPIGGFFDAFFSSGGSEDFPHVIRDGPRVLLNTLISATPRGIALEASSFQSPGHTACGSATINVPGWPGGGFHTLDCPLYANIFDVTEEPVPGTVIHTVQTVACSLTITALKSLRYGHDPEDPESLTTANPIWDEDGSMLLNPNERGISNRE